MTEQKINIEDMPAEATFDASTTVPRTSFLNPYLSNQSL